MSTQTQESSFDPVNFFIDYENGKLEQEDIVQGFQELINSGLVWRVNGHYSRTAMELIELGFCENVPLKMH